MSVKEIEAAISKLSRDELTELLAWLEAHYAQPWDEQIADDLDSGRLDQALAEAEKEYQAGLAKPL